MASAEQLATSEQLKRLHLVAVATTEYHASRVWAFELVVLGFVCFLPIIVTSLIAGVVRPIMSGFALSAIVTAVVTLRVNESRRRRELVHLILALTADNDAELPKVTLNYGE